ncbi:MAG: hypothetical protein R3Y63_12580 [Eubacteriales bacterium]
MMEIRNSEVENKSPPESTFSEKNKMFQQSESQKEPYKDSLGDIFAQKSPLETKESGVKGESTHLGKPALNLGRGEAMSGNGKESILASLLSKLHPAMDKAPDTSKDKSAQVEKLEENQKRNQDDFGGEIPPDHKNTDQLEDENSETEEESTLSNESEKEKAEEDEVPLGESNAHINTVEVDENTVLAGDSGEENKIASEQSRELTGTDDGEFQDTIVETQNLLNSDESDKSKLDDSVNEFSSEDIDEMVFSEPIAKTEDLFEESDNSPAEPSMIDGPDSEINQKVMVTDSKVDSNFIHGEGGGDQIFVAKPQELIDEGKLTLMSQEYVSNEGVKPYEYSSEGTPLVDERPVETTEAKQLAENTPEEIQENDTTPELGDVSNEEMEYFEENTLEHDALPQDTREEFASREYFNYQISDQQLVDKGVSGKEKESFEIKDRYFPDGVSNPRELVDGEVLYQINSKTPERVSPYFTNKETVDSCRTEDGKVDLAKLLSVLQIQPKTTGDGHETIDGVTKDKGEVVDYVLNEYVYNKKKE